MTIEQETIQGVAECLLKGWSVTFSSVQSIGPRITFEWRGRSPDMKEYGKAVYFVDRTRAENALRLLLDNFIETVKCFDNDVVQDKAAL